MAKNEITKLAALLGLLLVVVAAVGLTRAQDQSPDSGLRSVSGSVSRAGAVRHRLEIACMRDRKRVAFTDLTAAADQDHRFTFKTGRKVAVGYKQAGHLRNGTASG